MLDKVPTNINSVFSSRFYWPGKLPDYKLHSYLKRNVYSITRNNNLYIGTFNETMLIS